MALDLQQKIDRLGRGLSATAIRRPVFTTMLMLGLVTLGVFGFRGLPIDMFPNVEFPFVTVQTVYPGASPETIEREVTRRMEEAFNPVEGVDKISSQTLEGLSVVIVEFELGRDPDQAAQDLRTKIETIRGELPTAIQPPLVQKFDPMAIPIASLAISSSDMTPVALTALADETVRRRLEGVAGVGEVRLTGGIEREVRVFLEPRQMQALGISVADITRALQLQNMEVPAGRVERGNYEEMVRVLGRIEHPGQFGSVVVANRNGQPIRLDAVAQIEDASEDQRSLALVDGRPAISLDVLKVSGTNTVDVADGVKKEIAALEKSLPPGVEIQIIRDNSVTIRNSVSAVIDELLIGAFLTVVIVLLFLNDTKATVITAFALPVSVISAFILMSALGFTLNVLTLMALSLSIGILIDDAIVVIENIVRHRQLGQDHFTASSVGTREIILAVMATTFTTVAVFVPVAYMTGIVGRFFYQFGLTIAWAVLVSLFVSFTLTPMLSAWWGVEPHTAETGRRSHNPLTRLIARFNAWFDAQTARYRAVLRWALLHRKSTLVIASIAFIGALALLPLIGGQFSPVSDASEVSIDFETPDGVTLGYTEGKAREILAAIRDVPGIDYTYTTIGSGLMGSVNKGQIFVKLVPPSERAATQTETVIAMRRKLEPLFGVLLSVLEGGGIGGTHAALMVEVRGPDVDELQRVSEAVMAQMREINGVVDVRTSVGRPRPELRIDVDRDLANDAGLDIGQIAGVVRPLVAGVTATRWEDPGGEERDVVIQLPPEDRVSIDDVRLLPLATQRKDLAGIPINVTLGDIATVERGNAPARIDRGALQRVVRLTGSTTEGLTVSEASAQIRARIEKLGLPAGYSAELTGETEMMEETMVSVLQAILLAVILIYLILASQFESFVQPFAIMFSLPLSLVGVLVALLLTGETLNMMSMIGVILLMGLVTKNAILLVDNANEHRRRGLSRFDALIEAGAVRLRPIMMTTSAMVAGMLPIALALGEGSGFRAPMARAVIGGLITSTMLTLIVVPVAYTYLDGIGTWVRNRLISKPRAEEMLREELEMGLSPKIVGDHVAHSQEVKSGSAESVETNGL